MFTATISDASLLKNSIDTISQIIDEGIFKLNKDGILLEAADRAMVAVVSFKLLPKAFEELKADSESSIGINIVNLLQILKRAGSEDKIMLSLNENKLNITFKNKSVRKFSMPLLDITESEVPPISDLKFSAVVELKSSLFEEGINDADIVSDSVVLEASEKSFKMSAEGDGSSTELNVDSDSDGIMGIGVEEKEPVKSRYPLEYLKKMIKACKMANVLVLKFGNDFPMRMNFQIPDKLEMGFVLAPRVSED